ncbi:hypothetical protein WJM97_07495 [Okeanomitos corallinicola TIOX110]|uniref:Uncharacterized protein n=1 Tax=Okeanomitos corallinicola TIOX110 TaxID=3133117 RepID=A0ABZ2UW33_9CYAN
MNSKLYQALMILPVSFCFCHADISDGKYLSANDSLHQILSQNISENNDKYFTELKIISARDDQNDEDDSCLTKGECTT